MPSLNEYCVELSLAKEFPDSGSVTAGKVVQARLRRDIPQEDVIVARVEVDVPVKLNAESGTGLIALCRSMRIKDLQVKPLRKRSKQGCVILDRMRSNDSEAAHLFRRPQNQAACAEHTLSKITANWAA